MWYTIVISILAFACLIIGMMLVFDWWKPFKNEQGERAALKKKEKWIVGILVSGLVISLLSMLFSSNQPWLLRLRKKINGNK